MSAVEGCPLKQGSTVISKPAVQCCGVHLSEYNIVYEHDGVDKIRVDSACAHACAHADVCRRFARLHASCHVR